MMIRCRYIGTVGPRQRLHPWNPLNCVIALRKFFTFTSYNCKIYICYAILHVRTEHTLSQSPAHLFPGPVFQTRLCSHSYPALDDTNAKSGVLTQRIFSRSPSTRHSARWSSQASSIMYARSRPRNQAIGTGSPTAVYTSPGSITSAPKSRV